MEGAKAPEADAEADQPAPRNNVDETNPRAAHPVRSVRQLEPVIGQPRIEHTADGDVIEKV
jgi:hypothetical protein